MKEKEEEEKKAPKTNFFDVKYSILWLSIRWSDVCWVNTFVLKFRYRPWNNVSAMLRPTHKAIVNAMGSETVRYSIEQRHCVPDFSIPYCKTCEICIIETKLANINDWLEGLPLAQISFDTWVSLASFFFFSSPLWQTILLS